MPEGRVVGEPHHFLHVPLAAVVGRVRLAGDDDLHRPVRVQQDRPQPRRVAQHQGQPLVGRHPPGEPDGQDVRIQDRLGPAQLGHGGAALQLRLAHRLPGHRDQPLPQRVPQLPQPLGGHLVGGRPFRGRRQVLPVGHVAGHVVHLPRRPGRQVHAVGDRADRHLVRLEARVQRREHVPGHLAVQLGHPVRPLRQPQAHVRHVEPAPVVLGAERDDLVDHQAGQQPGHPVAVRVQVVPDQVDREPVDPGRHRGVRGEHRAGPHRGQRLRAGQAVIGDQRVDPLQAEEAGVTLVHVEDLGHRVPGRLRVGQHRAHPADAEQDLLLDPVVLVAAVEPVGGAAQEVVVGLDVGVQQQQRHPADLGAPDPRRQQPAAGHPDADGQLLAVGAEHPVDRQALRIVRRVVLLLPAVRGQRLPEVAEPVEQADPDDRHAEIGRRLEVVAGQDAETARVVRQRLGDAELHGEVGDGLRKRWRRW